MLTHLRAMNVANVAHGAGAVLGMLIGAAMSVRPRAAWWALTVLLVALSLWAAMSLRPWVNITRDGSVEAKLGYDAAIADRPAEAERWYRRALRIDPKDDGTWFNLGIICADSGRIAEAADCFRRAAELNPRNPKFREQDAWYRQHGPLAGLATQPSRR